MLGAKGFYGAIECSSRGEDVIYENQLTMGWPPNAELRHGGSMIAPGATTGVDGRAQETERRHPQPIRQPGGDELRRVDAVLHPPADRPGNGNHGE